MKCRMSGNLNDFQLIKLVEAYPILYDKDQARGSKNAELKDRAWKAISQKLSASERACITRWKSIRDRFGKECRRLQENPNETTNWDIFPHLVFLVKHYKHGSSDTDVIVSIKYAPKERRGRKGRQLTDGGVTQFNENDFIEENNDTSDLQLSRQLIALVRQHDVLYDKQKIRDSKNVTAKNEAWQQIATLLHLTEENCYKRWKRLRDRFAREYRYKQINPDKIITWLYFEDLRFLENHYRKGVPLNIEMLKRKGNVKTEELDYNWRNVECSTNCDNVQSGLEDEDEVYEGDEEQLVFRDESTVSDSNIEQFVEFETRTVDDLLLMPPTPSPALVDSSNDSTFIVTSVNEENEGDTTSSAHLYNPEEKLLNVIDKMEAVLKQSKDCLQALQQQNLRHKIELNASGGAGCAQQSERSILGQKVSILLDGLSAADRNKAERKIVRFLCECQIKILNNQNIEDVQDTGIP